jgi:type VI protein secretion system component VasK
MLQELLRPTVFWQLLAAGLIGVVVLWWMLLGSGRFARRRALRQRIAGLGQLPITDSALAALSSMRRGIGDAVQALLRPSGRPPRRALLYHVPWLMFVGDEAAAVPGLLAAAHHACARPAPPARESMAPDTFWRWWSLGPLTAIEVHADAVCPPEATRERGLWYQALLELAERRERLPLNESMGSAGSRFDQLFAEIVDRQRALRMGLARSRPSAAERLAIHGFVEDMTALQPNLRLLAERLFDGSRRIDEPTLHWRGLYFTGTAEDGAPAAFVEDLFQRLLPADQPLARPLR